MAPPTWRAALNIVEALPVAPAEMVANAAAWVGTNTCPMASPMVNISSRAHHRLEWAPSSESKLMETAAPTSPRAMSRRGPSSG